MGKKEEKNEKVITEVIEKNPQERMKNNFRRFRKIMQGFEIFLIVIPIIVVIIAAIIGIQILVESEENAETNESYTLSESVDVEVEEITTVNIVKASVYIVLAIVDYVLIIILLDNLKKLFASVEKNGTPFLKENISIIDRITIISVILGIIRIISSFFDDGNLGMGLIFLIIVLCISYVFRYGCELQDEVDRTV